MARKRVGESFRGKIRKEKKKERSDGRRRCGLDTSVYIDSGMRLPPSLCISTLTDGFR